MTESKTRAPRAAAPSTWHESVTVERLMATAESNESNLESVGVCIACGAENYEVEPDAESYTCEVCDTPNVYGAESLLIRVAF